MIDYRAVILSTISQDGIDNWLHENPVPENWQGNKWAWVFWYMPRHEYVIEKPVHEGD
jgi:hypothetical protein